MKKKLNRKYLGIIFVLFTIFLMFGSHVFAELTDFSNATNDDVMETITKVVAEIGKVGMNVGTAGLAVLLTGVAFILFILLQTVFTLGGVTENLLQIPFPDTVIFNKMALFDANFINPEPTTASPIYAIRTTISSVYDSFVIIAVALFTIIAMVIGIKLALATIASEKAKYKQAIGCWISGIILLVCLKWVLAGMFKINEEIVQRVYEISTRSEMKFEVFSLATIPLVGSTISTIMSWFGANASAVSWGSVPGYLGLVLKYLLEGLGGNFVGSLVAFVVLGQTFAIISVYLKRVFYCLLLGLVGPLVVAVDTFNRSMGKGSGILSNWLKQLALTIFMQSFHAVFLLVLVNFMVNIGNNLNNQYMSSLIIIILTAGLVKFEKLFKQLFGMGDPVMGDLKNGAMKAMATMGSVARAGKAIGDNSKKMNDAKKRKADIIANKQKLEQKQNMLNAKMGSGGGTTGGNGGVPTNGNAVPETNGNSGTGSGGAGARGDDEVKSILRNINNQMMQNQYDQNEQELRSLDKQLGQAEADISSAKLARRLAPANVAAGLAFGLGADDLASGAMLTTAMDHVAEKVGQRGADKTRSRMYDEAKAQGRENLGILREKATTNIKQEIKNTFTLKDLRDVGNILVGRDNNDSSNVTRSINDYKYIKDRNDRGHQAISSSVDNL